MMLILLFGVSFKKNIETPKNDLLTWHIPSPKGHYHSYERTCAVRYGECVNDDEDLFDIYKPHDNFGAPIHVTVGTAGIGIDYASFYEVFFSLFNLIKK